MRLPLLLGVILLASTPAVAIEVKVPEKTTARANVNVNESGQAIFGATPGRVEVTNLPPAPSSGEPWSVSLQANYDPDRLIESLTFSVPEGKTFLLTDIDGFYGASAHIQIKDGSGQTRLAWPLGSSDLKRTYATGVSLTGAVTVGPLTFYPPPAKNYVYGTIILMGRLY